MSPATKRDRITFPDGTSTDIEIPETPEEAEAIRRRNVRAYRREERRAELWPMLKAVGYGFLLIVILPWILGWSM